MEKWQLRQRQSLPLDIKIKMTTRMIIEFYEAMNGEVYVAFSGGKDSTVLLHLVRSIYPDVIAVFTDTGLEFPEIREFVKSTPNHVILHPKMGYVAIIREYGYPCLSKDVAKAISRYRRTTDPLQKEYRMWGTKNGVKIGKVGTIPKKWHYLVDAPFLISDKCCEIMKKNPSHQYNKETGKKPYLGVMASESNQRTVDYLTHGCNVMAEGSEKSLPLSFWTDDDIWEYIRRFRVPYSKIYDMGYKRTGCAFYLFGCEREMTPNRIQMLAKTHPNLYRYCLDKLNYKEVMTALGICYDVQNSLDGDGTGL